MALRIISTVLLAAGLLLAQKGSKGGGNNSGMAGGGMGMSRPEPLDMLAQTLKLNKDQKKDVKAILDDTQKEVSPLRETMVKNREQIATVIEAGKSQDEIDQAVKSFADVEAQVSGVEAKAFTKIFSGLDAEQKSNAQGLVSTLMMMHELFKHKSWNSTSE